MNIITITSDILTKRIKLELFDDNMILIKTKSCSGFMIQQFYVRS